MGSFTRLLVILMISSCAYESTSDSTTDVYVARDQPVRLEFNGIVYSGLIHWDMVVRVSDTSDSFGLRATGFDSKSQFHTLEGTIPVRMAGTGTAGAWKIEFEEDLSRTGFGSVTHCVRDPQSDTVVERIDLLPVAMSVAIDGTTLEGTFFLHPRTATLFAKGREPALEQLLTVKGPITGTSCTAFTSETTAPGVESQIMTGEQYSTCTARMGP